MNAQASEQTEEAQDLSGYAPRNVEGRLREWSRARWYAPINPWPPESAVYAVWKSPGRATDTQSDGGMAARTHAHGIAIARESRVQEVGRAIAGLPPNLREVIRYMYDVPQRERPKPEKSCADHFGGNRAEFAKRLAAAYGWLASELCIQDVFVSR